MSYNHDSSLFPSSPSPHHILPRLHGVTIGWSVEKCYEDFQNHLQEFGVEVESRELVNIIGGYVGEGYGKSTKDELGN